MPHGNAKWKIHEKKEVAEAKELLADWELARQGKELKWIDWMID